VAVLAVVGSRGFNDKWLMAWVLDTLNERAWEEGGTLRVVSGGAKGADTLAEKWAGSRKVPCTVFPAEWNRHGNKAGRLRNELMADKCTGAVAFWDSVSPGTRHMIDAVRRRGKQVLLIDYREPRELWTKKFYGESMEWSRARRAARGRTTTRTATATEIVGAAPIAA
jgi:hypothetical protein